MVQLSRCPTPARQRGVEPGQQIPDRPGLDGQLLEGWHLREFSSRIENLALDGDGARSANASDAISTLQEHYGTLSIFLVCGLKAPLYLGFSHSPHYTHNNPANFKTSQLYTYTRSAFCHATWSLQPATLNT